MQVGAFNSTHFDQSATWSSSLTSSNGFISASYDATKAFNGFTSGNHSGSNSGGTLTFAPNLTIPAVLLLRFMVDQQKVRLWTSL